MFKSGSSNIIALELDTKSLDLLETSLISPFDFSSDFVDILLISLDRFENISEDDSLLNDDSGVDKVYLLFLL